MLGCGDLRIACRLVAATNRAATEDELEDRINKQEVRRDLVARFSRIYELPPLRERPEEIIPLLITLIDERVRLKRGLGDKQVINCLRISSPAFEALMTYEYPQNIRDLQRLAIDLPEICIESIVALNNRKNAHADGNPGGTGAGELPLGELSIRLTHLRRLYPALGDEERLGRLITRDDENRFFEFHLEQKECKYMEIADVALWRTHVSKELRDEFPVFISAFYGEDGDQCTYLDDYQILRGKLHSRCETSEDIKRLLADNETQSTINRIYARFDSHFDEFMAHNANVPKKRAQLKNFVRSIFKHPDWQDAKGLCPLKLSDIGDGHAEVCKSKVDAFWEVWKDLGVVKLKYGSTTIYVRR